MIHNDQIDEVCASLGVVADAFGTEPGELVRIIAPEMDPADVRVVALALDLCPAHLNDAEVCADDGCPYPYEVML